MHPQQRAPALSLLAALAAAAAAASACVEPPPTYVTKTKAIFDARCAGCHRVGGIGPMPLTTYADIEKFKEIIRPSIESGAMPPWQADPECNTYKNDFSLTPDEKALVLAWIDDGMPEGEGEATGAAPTKDPAVPPIRYDELHELAGEPYLPVRNDEYRCYVVEWPHLDAKYITGYDVLPGDPTNVHHVNVFLNEPNDDADFVERDAADPLAGFSCSGGIRFLSSALIGAWAPGASGTAYPPGTGQLVEPGSTVTLEVHYAKGGPAGALPDKTSLALQVEDQVERRAMGAAFWWFNNWDDGNMLIPAGDDDVTHDLEVDPSLELAVVAPWIRSRQLDVYLAAIHMHAIGKRGELSIRSPVGDTCLVKIPRWDFHWQMGYELQEPAFLFLGEDKLYLSCTWDNSQGTSDVNWGTRTVDEMCIGYVYLVPR